MRKLLLAVLLAVIVVGISTRHLVRGQADGPATRPGATVTPAATALLDQVRDAYGKLKRLDLTGQVNLTLDAGGEKSSEKGEFTSTFEAPGKFRHEMKDDTLIVAGGEQVFVYSYPRKVYVSLDPIKERTDAGDLGMPLPSLLDQQNPSLLLALSKDASKELAGETGTIDRAEDVSLDGTAFQALTLRSPTRNVRFLFHPQTHLLRQLQIDLKQNLIDRGVAAVNTAMITVDYSKSVVDGTAAPAETFAWTAPADALQIKLPPPSPAGATAGGTALVGKDAPAFALKDMNDKEITLASLAGKAVILDFWATWCGPCVVSMPHIDALYKELSPKGLVVYAVNLRETRPQIQKFLQDHKLSLPVLLDTDGRAGLQYGAEAIPHTVVIGKDGKIRKVITGFAPGMENELRKVAEEALQ